MRARSDQSALLLRRRQDHQRTDGDQLRPQILRSRADLPAAQCLRPRHGLRARHSAIRAAPEGRRRRAPAGKVPFEIQGDGRQTRSFCHVDDLVSGVMVMRAKGEHLGIYHIGTTEEITIADLAARIAAHAGREIELIAGPAPPGGTERRCPDIAKLAKLGYSPRVPLAQGLPPTVDWYWANEDLAPRDLTRCIRRKEMIHVSSKSCPRRRHRRKRSGRMLPDLRARQAGDRAVARLHAAGEPDGPDRRRCRASKPWFPTKLLYCAQLRAGAARPRRRSGDHLPAGISLHQRHDQDPARQFRRALRRSPRRCSASARTISSSTSARTTAR